MRPTTDCTRMVRPLAVAWPCTPLACPTDMAFCSSMGSRLRDADEGAVGRTGAGDGCSWGGPGEDWLGKEKSVEERGADPRWARGVGRGATRIPCGPVGVCKGNG